MILDMFYRHFITLCMILLFGIKLWGRKSFKDMEIKYFWITVLSCLILVFEDSLEAIAALYPSMRFWRTLLSIIGYTFRSTAALGLLLVIVPKRHRKRALWIPNIVTFLISSTAFFTDIVFGFDDNYGFYRGPCGYVVLTIPLIYLLLILWFTFKNIVDSKGADKFVVLLSVAFCLGATVIDMRIGGVHLNEAIMISSILFYVVLYSHDNRRDALTGLLNRQAFYDDCKAFEKSIRAVSSLDMNGLKGLNDTQGHEAGDKALIKIGECINRSKDNNAHAYRIGGDEFIILFFHNNEDGIKKINESVKKSVSDNGYNISAGYALLNGETDLEEAIRRSDKLMYEDKSEYYRQTGIDRRRR